MQILKNTSRLAQKCNEFGMNLIAEALFRHYSFFR